MSAWTSLCVACAFAMAVGWCAWRERGSAAARVRTPLLVRASTLLFVLYAPFAWLVWFSDDDAYRRHLLLLWPAFPFAVPTDIAWGAITGRRLDDPALSCAAAPIASASTVALLALMRRGWVWLVGTALAVLALASGVSLLLNHLVRA